MADIKKVLESTRKKLSEADAKSKANRAMYKIQAKILLEASKYTPIDTSALINSPIKTMHYDNGVINGAITYGVSYARYVHDPNVKQNFKRQGARKEFLKLGANESKDYAKQVIIEEFGNAG